MNTSEALALKVLEEMLDERAPYVGVECLFAKLPIIECYDNDALALRVIVVYADDADRETAIRAARERSDAVMAGFGGEVERCWASICAQDRKWEDVDE